MTYFWKFRGRPYDSDSTFDGKFSGVSDEKQNEDKFHGAERNVMVSGNSRDDAARQFQFALSRWANMRPVLLIFFM